MKKLILIIIIISSLFLLISCKPTGVYTCDPSKSMNIILVSDWSGSMGSYKTQLKESMDVFSRYLLSNGNNKIGIVMFETTVNSVLTPTNNLPTVTNYINSLGGTGGSTCISCGLNKASEMLSSDPNVINIVVLLSDGVPNYCIDGTYCRTTAQTESKTEAQSLVNQNDATIYTISYRSSSPLYLMSQIATIGNGKSYSASSDELGVIYHSIASRLCTLTCNTTLPNYCSIGIKQCNGEQPIRCTDIDYDGCGDIFEPFGSPCIGNEVCVGGVCECKDDLTCSNGKKDNERWCDINTIKRCSISQTTCIASISNVRICSSEEYCNPGTATCECTSECSINSRRVSQLGGDYDRCISDSPCNSWKAFFCLDDKIYNPVSQNCECELTTCNNGMDNGDRWCEGSNLMRCSVNLDVCTNEIITETTCVAPQVCDSSVGSCRCIDECTVGGKRFPQLGGDYDLCIYNTPCNSWEGRSCPSNREFDSFSNKCECKIIPDSCNDELLRSTLRCSGDDERQRCNRIWESDLFGEYCWSYGYYDTNTHPETRGCVGGQYVCSSLPCTHNDCSPDGNYVRHCSTTKDNMCPTLSAFEQCPPDHKCSTTTWKCEPHHQCDRNDPDNGMYLRCNPGNNIEIQECRLDNDQIYRWQKKEDISCSTGEICMEGSDAYCLSGYSMSITSKADYPVKKDLTDISINVISDQLSVSNVIIIACLESELLGCTDENKYTSLVQIRSDPSGKAEIGFSPAMTIGSWYVSTYVADYKQATLTSKKIEIKNRLDLDVNVPTTNFINQDVKVTYRAQDIDTGDIVVPTVDIYLDIGGENIPFIHTALNEFSFKADKIGSVHYIIVANHDNYLEDREEGYIEVIHPSIEPVIMLDNTNLNELDDHLVEYGTKELKIVVRKGIDNLLLDTSNLKIRNPSQLPGEGTNLNFHKNADNEYIVSYNFNEQGKTYFLEGSYKILDTDESVQISKQISTMEEVEEEKLNPMIIYGGIGLFILIILIIIITVILKRK